MTNKVRPANENAKTHGRKDSAPLRLCAFALTLYCEPRGA